MSSASNTNIVVDPEIKEWLLPLADDEYEHLKANIEKEGCREPLKVWSDQGLLLDGHHRYQICKDLGVEYRVEEVDLPDKDSALDWVVKNQKGRR